MLYVWYLGSDGQNVKSQEKCKYCDINNSKIYLMFSYTSRFFRAFSLTSHC